MLFGRVESEACLFCGFLSESFVKISINPFSGVVFLGVGIVFFGCIEEGGVGFFDWSVMDDKQVVFPVYFSTLPLDSTLLLTGRLPFLQIEKGEFKFLFGVLVLLFSSVFDGICLVAEKKE